MPYGGSQWYYGMSQMVVTIDENLSKVWGKHQLAFGGRFRHERFGYLSDRSPDQIAFTNQATAVYDPATGANYGAKANTGYQDADFFLGAASSYSQRKNAPFGHSHLREYGFYIQDNFRVSQRHYYQRRARWEMHPAPAMKNNDYVTFDLKNNAIVLPKPGRLRCKRLHHAGHPHQSEEPGREVRNSTAGRTSLVGYL